jgi:excisionase family DNA binding protein
VERAVQEPLLLDVVEAACRLGVGRTTMYDLLKRGEIVPIRIGRRVLIPSASLDTWVDRQVLAAADAQ